MSEPIKPMAEKAEVKAGATPKTPAKKTPPPEPAPTPTPKSLPEPPSLLRLRQPARSKLLQETVENPVPGDVLAQTRALSIAMVRDGLRERASDIHMDPSLQGYQIRFRVDGVIIDTVTLDDESGTRLVRSLKSHAGLETGYTLMPQEGRADFDLGEARMPLRVSTAPTLLGEKLALRFLLPNLKRFRVAELGLRPADFSKVAAAMGESLGMVIVCGPTGSGKTTTLYALLHELKNRNESIVTLEDPAEDIIDGIVQIQINEKQGLTFAEGVKGILRLDPDAIMMGELRDAASARSALDAADSGHLFLTTLHARDAAGAVTALRNHGLADYAIAASVGLIIAQRLVRRLCPVCRKKAPPNEAESRMLRLGRQPAADLVWRATGCRECGMTGYLGRLGIFEVWPLTEPHCELIIEETNELALRRRLRKDGVPSLFDDMFSKAAEGLTTLDEMQAIGGFAIYATPAP